MARRWWGELGGVLHSFQTLLSAAGDTLIRVEPSASCGWPASGDILESPEELLAARMCQRCLGSAHYTKQCESCRGEGWVEVCQHRHAGSCPCATRRETCPDCDGSRTRPLTDDEVSVLEGYASAAMTS